MDKVLPGDLSKIVYEPLTNWPPGYSAILAPFYILFDGNYLFAGLTLNIICSVVLIIVTRLILLLLDVPLYITNIHTLIAGFFIYHFYFISSSDAVMATFFTLALYYTILLLKNNQHWKRKTSVIILCLFICGFIKFLFIPVVFIIPVYLIWKGYIEKQFSIKKSGIFSFLILTILFGGLLIYQNNLSGSVAYISEPGRGFFPEHLLEAYPFIPGSFLRTETISTIIPDNLTLLSVIFIISQWIHLVLLLLFGIFILKRVISHRSKRTSPESDFFYLAFFVSLAITFILAFLSVRIEKEVWDSGITWTYIEEQRYYAVSFIMIHIGFFVAYWHYRFHLSLQFRKLFYFLLFLLFIEGFRGVVFDVNRLINLGKEEYSWQHEYKFQKIADEIVNAQKKLHSIEKVVVAGTSPYHNRRVSLYSDIPILNNSNQLNNLISLNSTNPVLIIAMIENSQIPAFYNFIKTKETKFISTYSGFTFYSFMMDPH